MNEEPTFPSVLAPKRTAPRPPVAAGEGSPTPAVPDEIDALRAIVEGTARGTGQAFFQSLVRHLALALDVRYAYVAEFNELTLNAHTLAFWAGDRIEDNFAFDLSGTPREDLVRGGTCDHPSGVREKFPHYRFVAELGIESYLGVPLFDSDGKFVGHLAAFDVRPMSAEPRQQFIVRIFAARAAAELERLRAERERLHIEQRLRESEQRYRDFFEEAATACTVIGVDGRIQSVNRRAVEWHGYEREELLGMPILDLHPDTPAGKARAEEAFRKFLAGEEFSGLEVETRRKNGRPLWLSLWMKPLRGDDGQIQAAQCITVDITDRVLAEAERARLQQQNLYLQEEIKSLHNFDEITGQSPAFQAVLDQVRRVAPTDTTVLIAGETGTGKELIAGALHSASRRKDGPLIKLNCAALPTGLVESELFGHEKGAFSGALARRIGRFELAHGGTIFLDEIGDIPPEVQVKLLRVLQERQFERVGGSSPIKVDVRVLAATNRDLLQAVRDKTFREDLYYRLNVFPILLPPLRQRREDIPLLVRFLVNKFRMRIGKHLDAVSQPTMDRLLAYPWPGNIRELENILERAVILATGLTLDIDPDILSAPSSSPSPLRGEGKGEEAIPAAKQRPSLETVERDYVLTVLQETNWVIDGPRGAARILELHPNTLRNRIKKLGITRASHQLS